jgi:hypothetical protein
MIPAATLYATSVVYLYLERFGKTLHGLRCLRPFGRLVVGTEPACSGERL